MFCCLWKHACDSHGTINLEFDKLRNWYVEIGEYLETHSGYVENFHLFQLQVLRAQLQPFRVEDNRNEIATQLREKYLHINPVIHPRHIGNYLMVEYFGARATPEQRNSTEEWLSRNLDLARQTPGFQDVIFNREDPNWKHDPQNWSRVITLQHNGII